MFLAYLLEGKSKSNDNPAPKPKADAKAKAKAKSVSTLHDAFAKKHNIDPKKLQTFLNDKGQAFDGYGTRRPCWKFHTGAGCNKNNCPNSHDTADWTASAKKTYEAFKAGKEKDAKGRAPSPKPKS